MHYEIEKTFAHDFRKLKDKQLAKAILECIQKVSEAQSIKNIPSLKKLTGYKSAYRMRSGDYRIGVIIEDNIVTFVAFAHRKEIYRKFP